MLQASSWNDRSRNAAGFNQLQAWIVDLIARHVRALQTSSKTNEIPEAFAAPNTLSEFCFRDEFGRELFAAPGYGTC